ncbi:MAG: type II CRISPR-associated endonuclease Cas1 [Rhodanobacteraceae bacterium]
MSDRVLDLSDSEAMLSVRLGNLVVRRKDQPETTVPLIDLSVLVVSNPQVLYTQAVLANLAANGGTFIACDERHLPVAMLLPLAGNSVQTERFVWQAQAGAPLRKRLWRQVVRAKIQAQAKLLRAARGEDWGLGALAKRVRSGDPENIEAQAARRYWLALFGDDFRRDRMLPDQNRNLNYGYAILRGIVTRAICAVGLHPSFGLHHHNRYDAFCLADDLMEPLRPLVDAAVLDWIGVHGTDAAFDKTAKAALLQPLLGRIRSEGESRTVFDVAFRTASSVVAALAGERKDLVLPEYDHEPPDAS